MHRTIDESRQTTPVATGRRLTPARLRSRILGGSLFESALESIGLTHRGLADRVGVTHTIIDDMAKGVIPIPLEFVLLAGEDVIGSFASSLARRVAKHDTREPVEISLLGVAGLIGKLCTEFADAHADGEVDPDEKVRLRRAYDAAHKALQKLGTRLGIDEPSPQ
jgi:hypothetical protein